jgi:tyrosine-protein kinase Etk/Wzc
MAQYELNLRDYWRIIRKRRLIIITILIIAVLFSFGYTSMQPHIYQASATVRYTEQRLLATLLTDLILYQVGDVMLSQAKLIKSWSVAEMAAKSLNWVTPEMDSEQANQVIASILSSIDAKVEAGTNLVIINIQHTEAQKCADIANAVAEAYRQYNLIEKSKNATNLRQTVENRLLHVTEELSNTEAELQAFKEKNTELIGITNPYYIGTIIHAYSRYEGLKKEEELLLRKYTPKHPNVIKIRQEIVEMDKELKKYPEKEIILSKLQRNVNINNTIYIDHKQNYEKAKIAEGEKTPDVDIINLALVPSTPIKPNMPFNLLIGIILGLILALSFAFIIEHLDTSIGTIEEIEDLLKLPVLGVIPYLSVSERDKSRPKKDFATRMVDDIIGIFSPLIKGLLGEEAQMKKDIKSSEGEKIRRQLVWNYPPTSPLVEAYRTLRTNLTHVLEPGEEAPNTTMPFPGLVSNQTQVKQESTVILVTSTGPQEGKTITAANLATTIALNGESVILVDMDMRKPMIHKIFGLERENGLSEILIGIKKLDDCLYTITDMLVAGIHWDTIMNRPGIDNLHILSNGTSVPNPSEILSAGLEKLFTELRTRYKYIVCDCPPVLPVADVLIVGPKSDIVALVYRAGRTAKGALIRAKQQIISARINLKGLVLNHITPEIEVSPTYYYHYYYKYYSPSEKEAKGEKVR